MPRGRDGSHSAASSSRDENSSRPSEWDQPSKARYSTRRFRQVPLFPVVPDALRAVTLGELASIRAEYEPEVQKGWFRQAERLVEQYLASRIREVLFAPDHLRNTYLRVVHYGGEVV